MSDANFIGEFVPNAYGDRVQRAAVLYPFFGPLHTSAEVMGATKALVQRWRAALLKLVRAGWAPVTGPHAASSLQYLRNCRPTFMHCRPATRQCGFRFLCPFCHARWVREIWERLDMAFPNPRSAEPPAGTTTATVQLRGFEEESAATAPREFPYWLIERRATLALPLLDRPVYQAIVSRVRLPASLAEIVAGQVPQHAGMTKADREQLFAEFAAAYAKDAALFGPHLAAQLTRLVASRPILQQQTNPAGMLALTLVLPRERYWRVEQRQLFMVPAGTDYSSLLSHTRGKLITHHHPTRRVIFGAVARTCAYPCSILFRNFDLLALLLRVRTEFRLSATTGCFRNQTDVHENRRRRT